MLEKFISLLAENVAFVEVKFGIYLVVERFFLARKELGTLCYAYRFNVRSIENVGKILFMAEIDDWHKERIFDLFWVK